MKIFLSFPLLAPKIRAKIKKSSFGKTLAPNIDYCSAGFQQQEQLGSGYITKAWEMMDFLDKHTAWAKKRQKTDTKLHRRSSLIETDSSTGNKIEVGYKSEIIGVSIKNDPDKVRGKAGKLIIIQRQ